MLVPVLDAVIGAGHAGQVAIRLAVAPSLQTEGSPFGPDRI